MSLTHSHIANPNIIMSANNEERQGGAASSSGDGNLVALLTAALRGAASATHLRGEEDGKGIPAPASFNGETSHFLGWTLQLQAYLSHQGLLDVVLKGVDEQDTDRSVIADAVAPAADEVEEAAPAGGASVASGRTTLSGDANKRKASKAFVIILGAIKSNELLNTLSDVPIGNAFELWRRLHEYYTHNNEISRHQLMEDFYNIKQKPSESVLSFSARVKTLVLTLKTVGETVSASNMQRAFIKGLQGDFSQLRMTLTLMGKTDFQSTLAAALMYESQLTGERAARSGARQLTESALYAGSEHSRHGDGSGPGPCWRCGIAGHRKAECKNPPQTCSYCSKLGHAAADCHKRARDKGANKSAQSAQRKPAALAAAADSVAGTLNAYSAEVVAVASTDGEEHVDAAAAGTIAAVGVSSSSQPQSAHSKASSSAVNVTPAIAAPFAKFTMDTGASDHIFTSQVTHGALGGESVNDAVNIRVASGELLTGPKTGSMQLQTADGAPVTFSSVLSHDKMAANLISVSKICDTGAKVIYSADKAEVIHSDGRVALVAPRRGGIWVLEARPVAQALAVTAMTATADQARLWHCRLAHTSESAMKALLDAKAVAGLEGVHSCTGGELCPGCMQGKLHHTAYAKQLTARLQATRVLERVHADLMGPLPKSRGGSQYVLLLVDEYSRKVFGFTIARKSDAAERIIGWCRTVAVQKGVPVVEFHSDGGGEFISTELKEFFKAQGITATTTLAHTPQHNGIVERTNRSVMEPVRAVMQHAGAPQELWGEALQAVIYTRNRATLRVGTKETPEALWAPHPTSKPSVAHLHVWGCDGWVLQAAGSKLDSKAELCIHLGFDESKKGYRMLSLRTGKVELSRDVRFDEHKFSQCAALLADLGGRDDAAGFSDHLDRVMSDNEVRLVQLLSLQEAPAAEPEPLVAAQPPAAGTPTAATASESAAPVAASETAVPAAAVAAPSQAVPQREDVQLLRRSERGRQVPVTLSDFELTKLKPKVGVAKTIGSAPAAATSVAPPADRRGG